MKNFRILLAVPIVLLTTGLVSAITWTQSATVNTNWFSIASSVNGSVFFAVGGNTNYQAIYKSTDSGMTWTKTSAPDTNIYSEVAASGLAVSADGTRVVLATSTNNGFPFQLSTNNNPVLISTNSGATWTAGMAPITNTPSGVAMSADGQTLIVGTWQGWVYISTNSGMTWNSNRLYNKMKVFYAVASSNGKRLGGAYAATLWTTTDSGTTWVSNTLPAHQWLDYYEYPSDPNVWYGIASSADGTNLFLAGAQDNFSQPIVWTSTNAGATWKTNTIAGFAGKILTCVASSADGMKLAAGVKGGPLLISTNAGKTWSQTVSVNTNWVNIASSADGTKLAVTAYGVMLYTKATGGIWTSQSTPAPELNLTLSGSNLTVSWIVPSTNFVLQQSSDLGSWTDMTNTPALNLNNLQDEVILTPTNRSGFYRLKTP